jgi:hypothetical protein
LHDGFLLEVGEEQARRSIAHNMSDLCIAVHRIQRHGNKPEVQICRVSQNEFKALSEVERDPVSSPQAQALQSTRCAIGRHVQRAKDKGASIGVQGDPAGAFAPLNTKKVRFVLSSEKRPLHAAGEEK